MYENSIRTEAPATAGADAPSGTYSLVEVAQQTGIPMPTLLRYKREYSERIPSAGAGSQQRFPEEALEAFREIHRDEDGAGQSVARSSSVGLLSLPRLRRQKPTGGKQVHGSEGSEPQQAEASRAPSPTPPHQEEPTDSRPSPRGKGLLKLTEISEQLGIPYPTAARYASQHADRIPHEGEGRNRRFPPEAVDVFRQIRREAKPGRPPKKTSRRAGGRAEPPARQRIRTEAPENGSPPAEEGTAQGTKDATTALEVLEGRISALEQAQLDLGNEVRRLREEAREPVTVFASKR